MIWFSAFSIKSSLWFSIFLFHLHSQDVVKCDRPAGLLKVKTFHIDSGKSPSLGVLIPVLPSVAISGPFSPENFATYSV